jgi:hypothetical protein
MGCCGGFGPIDARPAAPAPAGPGGREAGGEPEDPSSELDELREDLFAVGALGALSFVVRGLGELPGRKTVVMLSDGFRIYTKEGTATRTFQALRRLVDLANRASVVVYTVDTRGLQTLSLTAADNVTGGIAQIEQALQGRRAEFFDTQAGLHYLAQQTGGTFTFNNNDIGAGIRRALQDLEGYYLIGYVPDEETFSPGVKGAEFRKVEVKVKRPGLRVRSRSGFYGVADGERQRPAARTRGEVMAEAVMSPFASADVRLRLTPLFGEDEREGLFIRSLLHVDGRDLTFVEDADGWRKAVFDVVMVTFDDAGRPIDQKDETYTVRVRGEAYQTVVDGGLVYTAVLPVKKAGAYQFRTAVRDTSSERLGSAHQFVEVPDVRKGRLALSGIVMQGLDPDGAAGAQEVEPQASPAVRRFRRGVVVMYSFLIYNARLDRATKLPRLGVSARVFHRGRKVYAADWQPLDPGRQADWKRIGFLKGLRFGAELGPGEYTLQVIVTDALAKEKQRTVTQTIDFELQ